MDGVSPHWGIAATVVKELVAALVGNVATGGALAIANGAASILLGFGDLGVRLYECSHQKSVVRQYQLIECQLRAVHDSVLQNFSSVETALRETRVASEHYDESVRTLRRQISAKFRQQGEFAEKFEASMAQQIARLVSKEERFQLAGLQELIDIICQDFIAFVQSSDPMNRKRLFDAVGNNGTTVRARALTIAKGRKDLNSFPFIVVRIVVLSMEAAVQKMMGFDLECQSKVRAALDLVYAQVDAILPELQRAGYSNLVEHKAVLAWLSVAGQRLASADQSGTSTANVALMDLLGDSMVEPRKHHVETMLMDCDAAALYVHAAFAWRGTVQAISADNYVDQMLLAIEHGLPSVVQMAVLGLEAAAQSTSLLDTLVKRQHLLERLLHIACATNSTEDAQIAAARTVHELATTSYGCEAIVAIRGDAQVKQTLEKQVVKDGSAALQWNLAEILTHTSSDTSGQVRRGHVPAGSFQPHNSRIAELITNVRQGMPVARERAASELADLVGSQGDGMRNTIEERKGIWGLITLLHDGSPGAKTQAARALGAVINNSAENLYYFWKLGGYLPLVAVLRDGTPGAQAQAAKTLQLLALSSCYSAGTGFHKGVLPQQAAVAAEILELGGIKALVTLAQHGTLQGKACAAAALGSLASVGSTNAVCNAGSIPPLVALLCLQQSDGEDDTTVMKARITAAEALKPMIEDEAALQLLCDKRGIEGFVQLIRQGSRSAQIVAAAVLERAAQKNDIIRCALRNAGAVEELAWLLGADDAECRKPAVNALRFLSLSGVVKDDFLTRGAINALAALLSSEKSSTSEWKLVALTLTAVVEGHNTNQRAMLDLMPELAPILVGLHSDTPSVWEVAAGLLRWLLHDSAQKELVCLLTNIVPLLNLLWEGTGDGPKHVMHIMYKVAIDSEEPHRRAVMAPLVDSLCSAERTSQSKHKRTIEALAVILSQSSNEDPIREEMLQINVNSIKSLIQVAEQERNDQTVQQNVAKVLEALVPSSKPNRQAVVAANAIPLLVKMLRDQDGTAQSAAAALAILAPWNKLNIRRAEGIKGLYELKYTRTGTKAAAAAEGALQALTDGYWPKSILNRRQLKKLQNDA